MNVTWTSAEVAFIAFLVGAVFGVVSCIAILLNSRERGAP